MDPFWLVWNPEGRAPTHKHDSPQSAAREAERLARLNPGQEFVVLKATASVKVRDVEWVVAPDEDGIPF